MSRDQNNPYGPPVYSRVEKVYRRFAQHLRVLRIRDFAARGQTLKTTDEHPYYASGRGWVKARDLQDGDVFFGLDGTCGVLVATTREEHPEGVWVYNLRIEGTHTYFVREQGVDAEPVWVHNAEYENAPVSDTSGTATVRLESIPGQKLPHYTVETEFQGARLHTEQVRDEEAGSTTIIEALRYQDVTQEGQIDLPDAQAAQAYQESVLRTDTGPYNYYRNSCVTHVVNVLSAGGLDLPASTSQARAALQRLIGG